MHNYQKLRVQSAFVIILRYNYFYRTLSSKTSYTKLVVLSSAQFWCPCIWWPRWEVWPLRTRWCRNLPQQRRHASKISQSRACKLKIHRKGGISSIGDKVKSQSWRLERLRLPGTCSWTIAWTYLITLSRKKDDQYTITRSLVIHMT